MKWINTGSRYILLSLNSLLLFLAIFSDKLQIPHGLQIAGRFHPLILHLPIGLLLFTLLIYFLRKKFDAEPGEVLSFLLHIAALSAVISALLGIFLSKEGVYDESLLVNHQWSGVGISILAFLLACLYRPGFSSTILSVLMLLMFPVLILGSHYGASITRGEGYLNIQSEPKIVAKIVNDSSSIFDAVVEPVLQSKCYNCHNEKKAKGHLIMTSLQKLLEGGKNGKIWVPGDPLNSHIMQRVSLEVDDKKHMPPRGKPQLSEREILLISEWIRNGASTDKRFIDMLPTDSFRIFAASFIPKKEAIKTYAFSAIAPSILEKLQSPYLTVQPLAIGSPALRADFFIREGFTSARLKEMEKISSQVVELNLTNMPVKDEDLSIIAGFPNLEYLNINGSAITGKTLKVLHASKQLKVISLSGTAVKKEDLISLASIKNLEKVFCWNTGATISEIAELKTSQTAIQWEGGYVPDNTERLQLTSPLIENTDPAVLGQLDSIGLKHPMPGVIIRYTTDGKDPDSILSTQYDKRFSIDKATRIKAIAVRPGWNTSAVTDFTFFAKGTMPASSRLVTATDKQYLANGILTLTDGQKGEISNLKSSWLGFRENNFEGKFFFHQPVLIHELVVSAAKNIGAFVMPPQKIEVWAGKDSLHLKLVKTFFPEQPTKYEPDRIEAHRLLLNGEFGCIRLIVSPVKKLPPWHGSKGEKAWIFLDEVFFN